MGFQSNSFIVGLAWSILWTCPSHFILCALMNLTISSPSINLSISMLFRILHTLSILIGPNIFLRICLSKMRPVLLCLLNCMTETIEVPDSWILGSHGLRLRFAVQDSGGYFQTVKRRDLLVINCSEWFCDPSNLLSTLKLGSCPVVRMSKMRSWLLRSVYCRVKKAWSFISTRLYDLIATSGHQNAHCHTRCFARNLEGVVTLFLLFRHALEARICE